MKYTTENIIAFLIQFSGDKKIKADTDLFAETGIVGDDFFEMLEKYSKQYTVDLNDCLWYFHNEEEGNGDSIGRLFFKQPSELVKRIPVTPAMLTAFANSGKWKIDYPEHKIPAKRYDILINTILFVLFISALILYLIFR